MAKPRIFVSSTCYDLGMLRSELRPFISNMGYEPIMSDYSDILYDPRLHTHVSCIEEVANCDLLVLILGERFGGTATAAALESIDLETLAKGSTSSAIFDGEPRFSITQLEVLKAVEHCIPIYAFVDDKVYHDHLVYEKNKGDADLISKIKFPSIQKNETARYIFEFINFLTHRVQNNSIQPFSRLEDIRSNLVSQWSQLYQRLLLEDRRRLTDAKRYQDFSERLEDLKAVVLASISTPNVRAIAKGAVQFRHLVNFICSLHMADHLQVLKVAHSWSEVLNAANIVDITVEDSRPNLFKRPTTYLILKDGTFYRGQMPVRYLAEMEKDWVDFCQLDVKIRAAISEALLEETDGDRRSPFVYEDRPLPVYLEELEEKQQLRAAAPSRSW